MLKIAFSQIYKYTLPEGHRFPMIKYELLPEQLIYEGTLSEDAFFEPSLLEEQWILRTHSKAYWSSLKHQTVSAKAARKIGFPMTSHLVKRGRFIAMGTVECALYALQYGVSLNVAGGTHHAYADHGEGFCVLNDIAIAANYLLDKGLAKKILIIDLDVHQGNGTASIFKNEDRVFTFSVHGAKNYPMRKEQSDLDIGLPDFTDDRPYLNLLSNSIPMVFDLAMPDFVFYLSGVDVLASDKLGRLGLSKTGCKERDRMVFEMCRRQKVPVAVSMGGGYSPRVADVVEAHANTFRLAKSLYF